MKLKYIFDIIKFKLIIDKNGEIQWKMSLFEVCGIYSYLNGFDCHLNLQRFIYILILQFKFIIIHDYKSQKKLKFT